VPAAGPPIVPAENAVDMGAIIRARFKGVDMSPTAIVAEVSNPDTPNPATNRDATNAS
jgi:hypothetical protein